MLGKLSFYGKKGSKLNWIAAFLKDRRQSMAVEGMVSGSVLVDPGGTAGLSAGTTTLSSTHKHPPYSVITPQVRLFADDCLLYRPIRYMADQEAFQCNMEALERCASTLGMRCNAKKRYLMNSQPSY